MEKWQQNLFIKRIREAIDTYDLIQKGDRILIGVSGGKDSTLLFYTLTLLSQYKIYDFEVAGLTCNHGMLSGVDAYHDFCKAHGMNHLIHQERYADNLSLDNDINPCYTCARLRKGILKRYAQENGYNKVAYGHTKDDLVETFLMNILKHGKLSSIPAKLKEEATGLEIIRPLCLLEEDRIIKAIKALEAPIIESTCEFAIGRTRANSEALVNHIEKMVPEFSDQVIKALGNIDEKRLLNQ